MGTPRAVAAALAALLVTAPVLARPGRGTAVTPPPPTDADKKHAGDLVRSAIAKSQAGDHGDAIELYLEAYAVVPMTLLLSNVGAEYQQDRKLALALKYFCMYLDKEPAGSLATYAAAQANVVQVQLGMPLSADGRACVAADPVAVVPAVVEEAPPVLPPPVPIVAGPTPGHQMRVAGLALGGAGLVSLGVGAGFGLKAKSISDDISDHCAGQSPCPEWPADIKDREAAGQRDENIQVVTMILGGALVAAGVGLYVAGRAKGARATESRPVVTLTPSARPGSVGLTLVGRF